MQRFTAAASIVQQLYRLTDYERFMGRISRAFARDLIGTVDLASVRLALDIGTGTGALARELAGRVPSVVGADISFALLQSARAAASAEGRRNVAFVLNDAQTLDGLPDASFDAAFASFALAETNPLRTLRAAARILRPGARFVMQEWGPYGESDPRLILDHTLAEFLTPEADGLRGDFRRAISDPRAWDNQLQDADDYADTLREAGFEDVCAAEVRPVTITFERGPDDFMTYALAWAWRSMEVAAMLPAVQQTFDRQVRERLSPLLDAQGRLKWTPWILRAQGVRKR